MFLRLPNSKLWYISQSPSICDCFCFKRPVYRPGRIPGQGHRDIESNKYHATPPPIYLCPPEPFTAQWERYGEGSDTFFLFFWTFQISFLADVLEIYHFFSKSILSTFGTFFMNSTMMCCSSSQQLMVNSTSCCCSSAT